MATQVLGTLGTIPTITVGGRVFTDLTNLIILESLYSHANSTGTFRKCNGTAGYQVTSGKTLTIYAVRAMSASASGAYGFLLAQSDNDCGFDGQSSGVLTNPVYEGGQSPVHNITLGGPGTAGNVIECAINFSIAATKYASMIESSFLDAAGAIAKVWLYCYEV